MTFYAFQLERAERQLGILAPDIRMSVDQVATLDLATYTVADRPVATATARTLTDGGTVSTGIDRGLTQTMDVGVSPAGEGRTLVPGAPVDAPESTPVTPDSGEETGRDPFGDHKTSGARSGYVWMTAGLGVALLITLLASRS